MKKGKRLNRKDNGNWGRKEHKKEMRRERRNEEKDGQSSKPQERTQPTEERMKWNPTKTPETPKPPPPPPPNKSEAKRERRQREREDNVAGGNPWTKRNTGGIH